MVDYVLATDLIDFEHRVMKANKTQLLTHDSIPYSQNYIVASSSSTSISYNYQFSKHCLTQKSYEYWNSHPVTKFSR